MRSTAIIAALAATVVACGGAEGGVEEELPLASTSDSLIPIADEVELPEDRPAAPPETVYVSQPESPPPPPVRRPASNPPPAAPPPQPAGDPAPVESPPPAPPEAPASLRLESGTAFAAVTLDSVHSRYNSIGDRVRVRVTSPLSSGDGEVVIPAGSVVTLTITDIKPAPNRRDAGTLVLSAASVMIEGESYPLTARATDFEYQLKGRGITGEEAAKTGIGAVAGGLIGRVVGGKKGTVIGAIGGAAAGAAVADQQADRDVVVPTGTAMTITLRDAFERP